MPPQNAVDGASRQIDSRPRQQHLQLARSPVRIALPQLHHSLLLLSRRLPRTQLRPPAALGNARQPLLLIASPPQISRGPRNIELLTQRPEIFLPALRRHYKTHPLLLNVHTPPG